VSIVLGENRYGKAEVRLLRVRRAGDRHEIEDLNVSTALSGDFEAVHVRGDNSAVLPTDSQKNAVYTLAAEEPMGEIEDLALRLGRHFVAGPVRRARVRVERYGWTRIQVGGALHPHAFVGAGGERRLATVTCEAGRAWVVAGVADLALLKSTGSEFRGFARDRYTTLAETDDRVLATAVDARWRLATPDADWSASFGEARRALLETFARHHSRSLQQTLYEMGKAVLEARPEIAEVRLAMPNRHHFAVDVGDAGAEVYSVADRPYGLIEGTVRRAGAPEAPGWLEW
jgi:urate oxidase